MINEKKTKTKSYSMIWFIHIYSATKKNKKTKN